MMLPKVKPWRSEKYRRFVASLPCCRCGSPLSNAHHENELGRSTMGGKCCDSRTLPLCPDCHWSRHFDGRSIWRRWDKDPEAIIQQTQAEWVRRGNKAEWRGLLFASDVSSG